MNEAATTLCPFCESEISTTAKKCRFCGEWIANRCRSCATPLRGEWAKHGICASCQGVAPMLVAAPVPESRGSAGNVGAAIASFFIPGLGQLAQGRLGVAIAGVILAAFLWVFTLGLLGWVAHVAACLDAALYKPKRGS